MKHFYNLSRRKQKEIINLVFNQISMVQCKSSFAVDSPVSFDALSAAKPFEAIPGPKSLPFIGNAHRYLPKIGTYSVKKWHEAQRKKFELYGPIVREELVPGFRMIHLFDPQDMETVSRNEGIYPRRDFFLSMKQLRELKPQIYKTAGIAPGNGKNWYDVRSKSQKVLLRPPVVKQRLPQINVIAEDFVHRIRYLRNNDMTVPNLMDELFKWALESIIYILFNKKFGCLSENLPETSPAMQYIRAVNEFFQMTSKVELTSIPIWKFFPRLSPSFRKLEKIHDFFFENAMKYVKEVSPDMDLENCEDGNYPLMELLLRHCSPEVASVMAIDSMAAGIDTTALSVAYTLRHLAENPTVQKKLQEEIDSIMPKGMPLTGDLMEKIPYLRACVKESMRLTPVVTGTSRTLDKDIVLSGYRIPAKTHMTTNYFVSSVLEENYPDALSYKPERWIRGASDTKTLESFAFQPFGFGPRMCIGRRIAEIEMFTILTKIMQNFWVENKHKELDIDFRLVLMIKNPLMYEFHERK